MGEVLTGKDKHFLDKAMLQDMRANYTTLDSELWNSLLGITKRKRSDGMTLKPTVGNYYPYGQITLDTP